MPYDIKVQNKTHPLDTLYLDFGRRVIESSTFCSSDERPKEFVASDDDDDGDDAQVSARSLAHVCCGAVASNISGRGQILLEAAAAATDNFLCEANSQ